MADSEAIGVSGRRLLVVEDEYVIATDLAWWLESKGAKVIGPAGSVAEALALIDSDRPDAAVLDINLGHERVFPVAQALRAACVPFVFLSGYDAPIIPDPFKDATCCTKPLDRPRLLRALVEAMDGRSEGRQSRAWRRVT